MTDHLAFIEVHPFVRETALDRRYGCIIGSALGDTIGLYTEFMTKAESEKTYPSRAFQLVEPATELYPDSHRERFATCAWTDDTDQALCIILSYLHNSTSAPQCRSFSHIAHEFAVRLYLWLNQGLLCLDRPLMGIGALVGLIVNLPHFVVNPVETATREWINSERWAAPNGSLMRTHPIGIIGVKMSEEECWQLRADIGRTTHIDPRCVVSCCIEVAIVRGLIRGEVLNEEDVNVCIGRSHDWVKSKPELMNPGLDETLDQKQIESLLEREEFERHVYAETLKDLELDDDKMGYVYKCIGSALLLLRLAIKKPRMSVAGGPLAQETLFEDLMVDLIMEGGDANTNGAAAGALLGAYLGYAKLSSHWTLGLAHKEWLMSKTARLAIVAGVRQGQIGLEQDEQRDGGVGLMTAEEVAQRNMRLGIDREKKRKAVKARRRAAGGNVTT